MKAILWSPVVTEQRMGIFFKKKKTSMLNISRKGQVNLLDFGRKMRCSVGLHLFLLVRLQKSHRVHGARVRSKGI